ncbi:MAG TPA: 3'-5' exonuclease [Longimicrobium sp.]|jgi:DNA polymerase III epsilon subunit-like protein|uniref:3'-5' exonuclease n=1 Tax=Longimicrobium sp. TaxID=2029185 RepID=UPI002ED94DDE
MTEVYISVDVEASGPVPPAYSMLSIGACVVGAPERSFYAELRPIGEGAVPAAIEVVGLPLDHFQRNGREPRDTMLDFRRWIGEVSGGGEPVFVGFNATFDWAFVNWYFVTFVGENPFGIGGVDIKSYYMGMANVSWAETRSSRLPAELKSSEPETHNALDDARRQAALFERMRTAQ